MRNVTTGAYNRINLGEVTAVSNVTEMLDPSFNAWVKTSNGEIWNAGTSNCGDLCRNFSTAGTATKTNVDVVPKFD